MKPKDWLTILFTLFVYFRNKLISKLGYLEEGWFRLHIWHYTFSLHNDRTIINYNTDLTVVVCCCKQNIYVERKILSQTVEIVIRSSQAWLPEENLNQIRYSTHSFATVHTHINRSYFYYLGVEHFCLWRIC